MKLITILIEFNLNNSSSSHLSFLSFVVNPDSHAHFGSLNIITLYITFTDEVLLPNIMQHLTYGISSLLFLLTGIFPQLV